MVLVEKPLELEEALARDDDAFLEIEVSRRGSLDEREPVAIGCDHPDVALGDLEVDAVQVVPGLVGGDGELGLLDHFQQLLRLDGDELDLLGAGKRRIVLGRLPDDVELGRAAGDLHPVVRLAPQDRGLLRQGAHDVVELLVLERDRSCFEHLRRMGPRDADLQIEGGDSQPPLPALRGRRLEEDAREDGHRALLLDDSLGPVEGAGELVDPDLQLHRGQPF